MSIWDKLTDSFKKRKAIMPTADEPVQYGNRTIIMPGDDGKIDLEAPQFGNEAEKERIIFHVEDFFGMTDSVFQEVVSETVHVDIHIINPTPFRNFYTLFTTGMSFLPMEVPEGCEDYRYAELILHLPPDWDLNDTSDERNYWPIRWLKYIARYPHESRKWIFYGATFPEEEEKKPFADNTEFCGLTLGVTTLLGDADEVDKFTMLEISADKVIYCFTLFPLFKEELEFKSHNRAEDLFGLFRQADVNEIFNSQRINVCKQEILTGEEIQDGQEES